MPTYFFFAAFSRGRDPTVCVCVFGWMKRTRSRISCQRCAGIDPESINGQCKHSLWGWWYRCNVCYDEYEIIDWPHTGFMIHLFVCFGLLYYDPIVRRQPFKLVIQFCCESSRCLHGWPWNAGFSMTQRANCTVRDVFISQLTNSFRRSKTDRSQSLRCPVDRIACYLFIYFIS